jgi:hypothetical protein
MREFAKGSFALRQAPPPLRLIYAGFLALAALGFLSQIGFEAGRIGLTPQAIAVYYRGSEAGQTLAFPKTAGQLLEVTHAHAFTMAVVFLILAHLFAATATPPLFKAGVLAVTFAGLVGDLAAPWLVRYGAPWCSWIALTAWIAQGVGNAVLLGASAWECLAPGRASTDAEGEFR